MNELLQDPSTMVLLAIMLVIVAVLRTAMAIYQSYRTRLIKSQQVLIELMERQDELNRQAIKAMQEAHDPSDEYQYAEKPKRDGYFYEDES